MLTAGVIGVESQTGPLTYHVRQADVSDGWGVARVHCDSFYPDAGLLAPLLRLDRVLALQVGSPRSPHTYLWLGGDY
jgi:hypothetical protein